jgi:photosystem II stability/assembly factor-like uncharacterized protein
MCKFVSPFLFKAVFRLLIVVLIIASFFSCKKSSKDTNPNSPSPCFDGVQNNGETGVDCGGPCTACAKQWTAISSGTSADLYSVQFVDERNGWAVGLNGTIIHSSDSGNTWSPQLSGVLDTLFSVCFIDASTGWIAGTKKILKTTNGGNTWSVNDTAGANESFYVIYFLDASKGWIGGTNSNYPFLNYTSNGGAFWVPKYSGSSYNQHGAIRSIDFFNQLIGYAVGTDAMGLAIQTTDGDVWAPMNLPVPADLYGCDFTSLSDGWCVGSHNYYYDVSLNAWRVQSFLPEDVTIRSVKNINTGQGWAVGNSGKVYKRRGPYEWEGVTNISTSNDLYSVSVSGATGCIVGQGGTLFILK